MPADSGLDHVSGSPETPRRVDRKRAERLAKRESHGAALQWLAVLVLCAVVLAGLIMFALGFRTYAITGGSMAGTIAKGSLAIARIVPVGELEVGDVITYRPPGRADLVTHRIVSIAPQAGGPPLFQTQGDANEALDPWTFTLDAERQARYVFQLPYLGYVLLIFASPLMRIVLLVGLALLLTSTVFLKLWREAGQFPDSDPESPEGNEGATGDTPALVPADPIGAGRRLL